MKDTRPAFIRALFQKNGILKHLSLAALTAGLFLLYTNPANADIRVARATACTGIEDREPVGSSSEFSVEIGRLYFFSELLDNEGSSVIRHLWYHGNKKVLEVELNVNSPRWRTWSYKNIYPGMKGPWKVEIVHSSGEVIHSRSFTVK